MPAKAELEQIAKEVAVCTRCSLCKTRTRTVPGEGSPTAKVLFIGEAPGFHEDQQGRPFVGQSGQLLNKLLNAIKIQREDVFIANVVKCRPPNNLDPTPEQIAACQPYLDRQIAAINPRLIVTLGRFSMARYWPGQRISQIHGQPKTEYGRLHLPMFHPAAALRDPGRTMAMFKADGLTIPALLQQAEELARTELWGYSSNPDEAPPLPFAEPAGRMVAEPPVIEAYRPTPHEIITAPNGAVADVPDRPPDPDAPAPLAVDSIVSPELQPTPAAAEQIAHPNPAIDVPAAQALDLTAAPPRKGRKKPAPDDGRQLRMF